MRLRNIIQDYTIYVNNEEQDLLDKLPERAVDRATISEREQVIACLLYTSPSPRD